MVSRMSATVPVTHPITGMADDAPPLMLPSSQAMESRSQKSPNTTPMA